MDLRTIALSLLAILLLLPVGVSAAAGDSYYAYGDSVTRATGYADLNPDGSDCYIMYMQRTYDPSASADHNQDGGSKSSVWGLANITTHYANETYYCIMFGLNDDALGVTTPELLGNLLDMYNYTNTTDTTPIILVQTLRTPTAAAYTAYPSQRERLTLIQEGLRASGIPFVRAYDAVDTVPGNGIADEANTTYYASDGLHLNVSGQQKLGDYLWESLQPPSAGFSANKTASITGTPIQFTSTSTGHPSLFTWDFGDGTTSLEEFPVHTYTDPGIYTVSLTVSNVGGSDTVVQQDYVAVVSVYDYYQTIAHSAGDYADYQQDVVIHRSAGTAYTETAAGLTTWHLYVGSNCRADYGDIRFTDSTGSTLAYYLWPDYDSSSARFTTRLKHGDEPGVLTIKYGLSAATTTSSGQDTFPLFDDFTGTELNTAIWEYNYNHFFWREEVGSASVVDGTLRLIPGTTRHDYSGVSSKDSFGQSGMMVETSLKTDTLVTAVMLGDDTVTGLAGAVTTGRGYGLHHVPVLTPNIGVFCLDPVNSTRSTAAISTLTPPLENNTWTQMRFGYNSAGGWVAGSTTMGWNTTGTNTTWLSEDKYLHLFNSRGSIADQWTGITEIDYVLVRTYSSTPPAATVFSGERETAAQPAGPSTGIPIYFQSTISTDATTWLWNFGDGTTSTERHPTHTYATTGTYRVTLTATNQYGSRSTTQTLHVFSGTIPDPTLLPTISPGSTPTLNGSAFRWDPETGYYTSYWFSRDSGFIDVHGLFFSLMLPLTQIFGSWVFLIIWGTLCMGFYLYTQDTTMPFIVGVLGGSMMAFLMGEDALVVMLLTMAFAGGGILAKVLLGRV